MKTLVAFVACSLLATGISTAQSKGALTTKKDKLSYGIGVDIGRNLKRQEIPMNLDAFMRGIRDGMGGKPTAVAEDELQRVMQEFGKEMMDKQAAKMKALGEANKKAGAEFQAAYKKKEGVTTLPSGIQYRILNTGTGPKPDKDKTVVCHYRGTIVDGREFDSSYKRGEPATFALPNMIKGWQEILPMMPVGSKWEVVIPSELGYGEMARNDLLGPNSTLVFEIELISIK